MAWAEAEDGGIAQRRDIMACFARATADELAQAWENWPDRPPVDVVRAPEIGLVMLRGRTGGGGAPFNLGEATVTRAVMRLATGEIGVATILGRDKEKARLAAIFDALSQAEKHGAQVRKTVLAPLSARLEAEDEVSRRRTAATRVEFFTLARGED